VNTLIIINTHIALKIMDQADGYASLMPENKRNRKKKRGEILNLGGARK
jgi:hypothetical protein